MIHSPLLNARLLPSSLTTQSIEVLSGRKGKKHGRYRRSILVSVDHRRNAAGDHVGHELRSIADHQRALRKKDSGLKDPRLEANETWDRIQQRMELFRTRQFICSSHSCATKIDRRYEANKTL
jgi:hypothetical protein